MSTVRRGEIVRARSDRVNRRRVDVGSWREAVAKIQRVDDALEGRGDGVAAEGNAGLMTVLSSHRMPDLASRLRRDLQAEGVVISEMGKASSGRVTVVTLRLPFRSEVRARAGGCAAAGVDFICLAEAG